MEWYDACINSSRVTVRYERVPSLDEFPIHEYHLDPVSTSFSISGYLPRLPDNPGVPEGQIPDRADLYLSFVEITDLQLSGVPDLHSGKLQIIKNNNIETQFKFKSSTFQFAGTCERAVISGFGVLAKNDPNHPTPRGPRLFSHQAVWNSCLLLLQEYGYSLRVSGHSAHKDYPSYLRWYATTDDGTSLHANSPIELLGLASLHRYHKPNFDEPYWWQIDGPKLLSALIENWEQQSDPRQRGEADST